MRCKSCKQKIENENLFRCPHCGKPIEKKKKADPRELMSTIPFLTVYAAYAILNFSGFFFKCEYYSTSALMIAFVLYSVAIPFIIGNYRGLSRSVADCIPIVISIPFIANWFVSISGSLSTLSVNALSTVYYFSVLGVLLFTDIIMILKTSGIIGCGKIAKWICLAAGVAEFIFTIVFYSITKDIKPLAMLIIAVNSLLPAFTAYHVIMRDSRE